MKGALPGTRNSFCVVYDTLRRVGVKLDSKGATILLRDDTPAIWMPLEESGLYTCRPVNMPAAGLAGAVTETPGVHIPSVIVITFAVLCKYYGLARMQSTPSSGALML